MLRETLILVVLSLVVPARARLPFETCKEGYPAPLSFDIPECKAHPCEIHAGDKITINVMIRVARAVERLPVRATVKTADGSFDYPLPSGDACNAIAGGCPKEAGDYLISFPMKVDGVKPGTEASVRMLIQDSVDDVVACGWVRTTIL